MAADGAKFGVEHAGGLVLSLQRALLLDGDDLRVLIKGVSACAVDQEPCALLLGNNCVARKKTTEEKKRCGLAKSEMVSSFDGQATEPCCQPEAGEERGD